MGFRLDQWFHRELLSLPSKLTRTHDGWKGDSAPRLSLMLVVTGEGLVCGPLPELSPSDDTFMFTQNDFRLNSQL